MMNKYNQRKVGAILSYVSIFVSTAVQLLYTPFLVGGLGQSEYGLFSLVSSMIGYLSVLDLGFGNAIVVHVAKYRATSDTKKEKTLLGMFRLIYITIGVIAAIIGIILSCSSDAMFGGTMSSGAVAEMRVMLLILSFNLFISFSFSIYNSIIIAREKFIFQKSLTIISTIAKPLIMIPLLFLGFKSVALCVVITLVNLIVVLSNYVFCRKKLDVKIGFSGFDKSLFGVVFGYSFWVFLNQVVDQVNWNADQFILGAVSGTIAVSIYSAASIINSTFINLSTAISGVMLPKLSKMVAKGAASKKLSDEFIKVGRAQFIVIFLIVSGFILLGREFLAIWLGEGFGEAYSVALLLVIPMVVPLIQNTGLSIIQAMNKFKFRAIATAVMSIFNIVISIFLAKNFGAPGAALGTAVSIILVNVVIMNIYYAKIIKIDIMRFWKNIIGMFAKFLVPVLIVVLLMCLTRLSGAVALLVYGGIYVVIYILFSYLFVMDEYEKGVIKTFTRKIRFRK